MKNCYKPIIACGVIALGLVFVLPRIGVPIAGASLLILLLMIGCCVIPIFMIMRFSSSKKGGCCRKMDNSKPSTISPDITEQSQSLEKPSCH